jgi:hypothetical protein
MATHRHTTAGIRLRGLCTPVCKPQPLVDFTHDPLYVTTRGRLDGLRACYHQPQAAAAPEPQHMLWGGVLRPTA